MQKRVNERKRRKIKVPAVAMKNVQRGDEKLVSILLFVAG